MNIVFYSFSKRKNSTKVPSSGGTTYDCQIKSPCSMLNPVIELALTTAPNWNYCYIQAWNRYYWITDKTFDSGIWFITCKVDPLASGKSDILGSSAHVLYSTSNYDLKIADPRIVNTGNFSDITYSYSMAGVVSKASLNAGTYVLTVMSDANNITTGSATVTYFMSLQEMTAFARKLNSQDILDQLLLLWNNPYEGIIECYYIPFTIPSYIFTSTVNNISIADLPFTGVSAKVAPNTPLEVDTMTTAISIPWAYSDYRNQQPFTTFELFVPYCGAKTLDQSVFLDKASLALDYSVDFITGNVQAVLHAGDAVIDNFEGNCKIQLPLAQAQSRARDTMGAIAGFGGMIGGILAKNPTMLLGGGALAFNSITTGGKYNTMGGFNGSILGMALGNGANPGAWQHINLTRRTWEASDSPANMRAIMGNALNKVISLSALTGYVQTLDASVSGAWTDAELSEINAALDSGIYIE